MIFDDLFDELFQTIFIDWLKKIFSKIFKIDSKRDTLLTILAYGFWITLVGIILAIFIIK